MSRGRPHRRLPLALVASLAALAASASAVLAAGAGDLDPSFGGDGKVTFDVFGGVRDSGRAAAIQADGRIVVAGFWAGFASDGSGGSFALARFNPDGSLDTSFGSGGRVLTSFPGGPAAANGVAIQPDGRIVAVGWRDDADGVADADLALARYHPNGSLDASFSGDGKQTTSFGGHDVGHGVAIQPDGAIVVAGETRRSGDSDFALARYNANGSLDTSFDGDGKLTTGFDSDTDAAFAVAIQTNAAPGDFRTRIVAAGQSNDDCPPPQLCLDREFTIARYRSNGALDTSFSGDGKHTAGLGGDFDRILGLAVQGDGKIVAAGGTDFSDGDFALARYSRDGSLDSAFDGDGKLTTGLGGLDVAEGVAIQGNGKIVAAGWSEDAADDDFVPDDFALARYNPTDGSLDSGFAGNGVLSTSFGAGDNDQANAVAIQGDGKIVAAATSGGDFALARYHAVTDDTPPQTTITSGPSGTVASTSASFAFSSSERGSSFQCRLDSGSFLPCSSPKSYGGLGQGPHTFRVRAIDAAGNVDPTAAVRSWTVDTVTPADTSVALDILGRRLGLNRKGVTRPRLRCPADEASPPCEGRLALKTRKPVRFLGRTRRVTLAGARFALAAGETRRLRLKLSQRKLELVRSEPKARRVRAIARIHDQAGNRAKVAKPMRLVP